MEPEEGRNSKSFRVVLRLCPQERTERPAEESRASVRVAGLNRVTVDSGRGHRAHVLDFDAVWNEEASPRDIYDSTAKPLVEYLMKGYNGCVIAYGPSTSGETHSDHSSSGRSLISRAADDIFNSPEASNCKVRVSFYHVSNEKIYDLLEPQPSEVCRIHDTEEVVLLEGLREVQVNSAQELLRVYRRGTSHRNTGVSKGDFASKSHLLFCVTVIHRRHTHSDSEGAFIASKLTLVDLASSAKSEYHNSTALDIRRGFHVAPENPQEAKTLKRSLTIFRNVIFCLSAAVCQHVPYRESKLTRVLRDCLAGNCRTCLLITLATHMTSVTETMSCLQFAARAMNVPSRVIHMSHTHYTPAQVPDVRTTEKSFAHLPREQGFPPVSMDRRSQPALPPILSSLAGPGILQLPRARSSPRSRHSMVGLEAGTFLPHLQQHREADVSSHHGRAAHFMEGKYTDADVCAVKAVVPRSPRLSFSVAPGKDSALLSHQHPTVKHSSSSSSSSLVSSSTLGAVSECLNCRQERKIREEYDKFIIQVKRDRDRLSERVTELERELKSRGRQEETETRREVREGETGREVRQGETRREMNRGEAGGEVRERATGNEMRKGETGREVKQGEMGNEMGQGETGREVRQGDMSNEIRQGETGREVRQGDMSNEIRQGETGREVRQGEMGNEIRQGETGREVRQGKAGGEMRQGEIGREMRQGETGREVRLGDGDSGGEMRQGMTAREVRQGETSRKVSLAEGGRAEKEETRRTNESKNNESQSKSPEEDNKDESGTGAEREAEECNGEEGEKDSDSDGKESDRTPRRAPEARDCSEAELISCMDDNKLCYEKVCLENAELKAKLETLLKVINSGCHGNTNTHTSNQHMNTHSSHTQTDAHSSQTHSSHTQTDAHSSQTHSSHTQTDAHSHTHKVTTNTEMVVVSHCVSQQCTTDLLPGGKCSFSSSPGFPLPSESGFGEKSSEPTLHTCHCESKLHKTNIYKQLRREHNLLLEVMLVLYKREWFLQDAMPYIRRTLTKCGLTLEEAD